MLSTNLDYAQIALGATLQHTSLEAYLEPSQTTVMKLFCKKVKCF